MPQPSGNVKDRPFFHYFIAGQIGGMFGKFLCFPFDTAKTHQQMLNTKKPPNWLKILHNIIRKEGFFAIYRGIMYPFLGYGIIFSSTFGINGSARSILLEYRKNQTKNIDYELNLFEISLCGGIAGGLTSFIRGPIERVKCWSQIQKQGTLESTRFLIKNYGIRGIYTGLFATIHKDVPKFMIYYPVYKTTKHVLNTINDKLYSKLYPNYQRTNNNTASIYLSGGISGVVMYIIIYPLDVVKTRIQSVKPGHFNSISHCWKDTYNKGGIKIFYNGLTASCYRAAALHSGIWLLYERTLNFMETKQIGM